MKLGVPRTTPASVSAGASPAAIFETPKSSTLGMTVPSGSFARKMLSGLMSRWTTPTRWAFASALATCTTMPTRACGVIGPFSVRCLPRSWPSSSSMTMYGAPDSVVPESKTCTTCGLFTCAATMASRANRASTSARPSSPLAMSLTTTRVSSTRCSASHTVPIPPCPIVRTRRTLGVTKSPGLSSSVFEGSSAIVMSSASLVFRTDWATNAANRGRHAAAHGALLPYFVL
jgi:hypothetical protein